MGVYQTQASLPSQKWVGQDSVCLKKRQEHRKVVEHRWPGSLLPACHAHCFTGMQRERMFGRWQELPQNGFGFPLGFPLTPPQKKINQTNKNTKKNTETTTGGVPYVSPNAVRCKRQPGRQLEEPAGSAGGAFGARAWLKIQELCKPQV